MMKQIVFLLGTVLCLALPSCKYFDVPTLTPPVPSSPLDLEISPCDDGESIDVDLIPQAIIDFLDENYPNSGISDADIYQFVNGALAYAIELDDDLEILFDGDGLVISASNSDWEDDEDDIPFDELPAAVLDYLAANYPDATIVEAEFDDYFGTTYIEIEIKSPGNEEQELYFTTSGEFLCLDDDDNDDDDDGDNGDDDDGDDDDDYEGNVPGPIADYVNANYPEYEIDEIDDEDLCNDAPAIKVELEGPDPEPELYFDLQYNFLFAAYEADAAELPAAVLATLEAEYPGYALEDDDVERYEYPNGAVEYRVELEWPGDEDDIEVVVTAAGEIVCTED